MRRPRAAGGWPAILYTLRKARASGGILRMIRALRSRNACKTCALGMGGQSGGMVDEKGRRFEVCKKSVQAMAADLGGAIHPHFLTDLSVEQLRRLSPRELEAAGRITQPLYAGPLDSHYRPIEWSDAISRIARKLKATAPDESFFYFSGRSSNEAGFLLQLFARLYGTNNVNNCSYYCHQASGVALTTITGSSTASITLEDLDRCDLLLLAGANPASNHPRFMKSLVSLRRRGGRVIVINPLRELGLVRFAVPSDPVSLLFPSRTSDLYLQPHIGGDIALFTRLARTLLLEDAFDQDFVSARTEGFGAWRDHVTALSDDDLRTRSGVPDDLFRKTIDMLRASRATIFAWAMGLTHHEHGVGNVHAIGNLALLRGMVGRRGAGLLPLRGHSNVQGIGSVGVTPVLKQAIFEGIERHFGVKLPTAPGMDTLASMERAHAGGTRFAMCLGGNLYGSNPDAHFAAEAFRKVDMTVYLSTTLNTGHAWGTGRETIILPVLARDEEPQPTTQESMFSFVRLSEGGPPRHKGPRSEVETIADIAHESLGSDRGIDWNGLRGHRTIRKAIAAAVPGYESAADIDETRKEFHIAGRALHEPHFPTPSGRASFHCVEVPDLLRDGPDTLRLMTMRSEGQFNTVVYDDDDRYRGQECRNVILMAAADMDRMGLRENDRVTVRNDTGVMNGIVVRAFDIPPGNAAMYYPEANVLVPRRADPASRTPAFKSFLVRVDRERAP